MSVWFSCPSKRPPEQIEPLLNKWRERGYKIALWRDEVDMFAFNGLADLCRAGGTYPGYALAQNDLCGEILRADSTALWIVCAGDDIEPDPNKSADEIDLECRRHFYDNKPPTLNERLATELFGVMQPTGDRWGDAQGAYIDRVAGSPWIGREFARRMYGGAGPYWYEYTHQFVDEELQAVAMKLGVFWQRPDLSQLHQHWGRPKPGERMAPSDRMPGFLAEANSPAHWQRFKRLFEERRAAGFPGHEPLS